MVIKPKQSGRQFLLSTYKTAIAEYITHSRKDPKRLYHLRCSQLPFCPSSVLMSWNQRGMVQQMGMRMAYYVSVGTAVHTVMQSYLSQSGKFLADYSCAECGAKYPLSTVHECCGFPTQYEEVAIDYKTIQGHIDGIFVVGKDFYIVDYKTTSLSDAVKKSKYPGIAYKSQVLSYAYLLYKQYGIRVRGVMLMFLPRDNPFDAPTIWEHEMRERDWEQARIMLKTNLNLHRRTMRAKTASEFKSLMAVNCGSEWCSECKKPVASKLKVLSKRLDLFPIKKDNDE